MMYRASIERILHLQETLAVTGSQLDTMQSMVATLREELNVALLAATAPPPASPPEPVSATDTPGPSRDAPVASPVPDSGMSTRRVAEVDDAGASADELKEEVAASSASSLRSAGPEDNAAPVTSEADQLRQRRLQFLERNASRGSSASVPEELSRTENEEH